MLRINLFASFAKDKYLYPNKTVETIAGPGYFIESALQKLNANYINYTIGRGEVEIQIRNGNEKGIIVSTPKVNNYPKIKENEIVLISTLLDEVKLINFIENKYLCLDIQGYVRDGKVFGKKRNYSLPTNLNPLIMKATKLELSFLETYNVEQQKERILLVTNSSKGYTIYFYGKRYDFEIKKPITSINSMGAGDTFFTNFCIEYFKSNDVIESARLAQIQVEELLQNKNI